MSVAALSHYNATALWLKPSSDIHAGLVTPKHVAPVPDIPEPLTRRSKRRKVAQQDVQRSPGLLDLPEELTMAIIELVDAADLAFLSMTCRPLRLGTVRSIGLQWVMYIAARRAHYYARSLTGGLDSM